MPQTNLAVPVTNRDHRQGQENAPVTLVEFGDYECPYCAAAASVIQTVQKKLGPSLRFVFRNFPLSQTHPNAEFSAEAAEAAGVQGKFWEMHDMLFERQSELGPELIHSLVRELKLDDKRLFLDLDQRRFLSRVKNDLRGGLKSGVFGTPGFFINGWLYQGSWSEESLLLALKAAIPPRQKAG
jgi:protein-disulfide isomerase